MSALLNAGLYTSASDRWFTPPDLLADVAAFLGRGYLDPCPATLSSPTSDGLSYEWTGNVFVNPPYGRVIGQWTSKATHDPVDELLLLVPARTDTRWFQPLFDYPICFLRGRLHFSGHKNSAPFPSALIYRGERWFEFREMFLSRGAVVRYAM